MTTDSTPRVWIGCLAAYNAGDLHGDWMDATDPDDLAEHVAEMLKTSPVRGAEEFHVCDFENFHGVTIDRYDPLEKIAALGAAIDEADEPDALAAWLAYDSTRPEQLRDDPDAFRDAYIGRYDSVADFAREYATEDGPDGLSTVLTECGPFTFSTDHASYVDWEQIATDYECGGCSFHFIETPEHDVFAFHVA